MRQCEISDYNSWKSDGVVQGDVSLVYGSFTKKLTTAGHHIGKSNRAKSCLFVHPIGNDHPD